MHASHELDVSVVSPEEAEFGTAEFWVGDRLFGFTRLEDGELGESLGGPGLDQCPGLPGLETRQVDSPSL